MKSPKLETFAESFAFRDCHNAFPIERIIINNGSLSVYFDYSRYEAWLADFQKFGEASNDSTSKQEWLDQYADTPIEVGFGGSNAKKLWQATTRLQDQIYACARRHPYCQDPASKSWAHPSEVTA